MESPWRSWCRLPNPRRKIVFRFPEGHSAQIQATFRSNRRQVQHGSPLSRAVARYPRLAVERRRQRATGVGRRARQLLARAEAREAIRVSPVAISELTALHTLGRVRLARSLEQWVRDSLDSAGVRVAELTPVIALDAGSIPREALADPLDRLLVATAETSRCGVSYRRRTQILQIAPARTGAVRVQDAPLHHVRLPPSRKASADHRSLGAGG